MRPKISKDLVGKKVTIAFDDDKTDTISGVVVKIEQPNLFLKEKRGDEPLCLDMRKIKDIAETVA